MTGIRENFVEMYRSYLSAILDVLAMLAATVVAMAIVFAPIVVGVHVESASLWDPKEPIPAVYWIAEFVWVFFVLPTVAILGNAVYEARWNPDE